MEIDPDRFQCILCLQNTNKISKKYMLPFCSDQHAKSYDISMIIGLSTGNGVLVRYRDEFEKINSSEVDADNQGGLDLARDSIQKLMSRVDQSIKYNILSAESYDEYEARLESWIFTKNKYEPLLSNIVDVVKKINEALDIYDQDLVSLYRSMRSRLNWINEQLPY